MSDALRELIVSIDFNNIDMSRLLQMDRAIDSVESNVNNLGGDLNRLGDRAGTAGAEGSRAMDKLGRHTDGAGDAMDELGRDAVQAGNKVDRAANEATRELREMGNAGDEAMDEMKRAAGGAADELHRAGDKGDKAGDDIRAASDRAADALRDMGNSGERAAGDIIRAGGRADSELESVAKTADRASDALEDMGNGTAKLNHLTQVLDNINGRIEVQERKLAGLKHSLDSTFNDDKRDKLTHQILRTENSIIGLTKQSNKTAREIWKIEDSMRDVGNGADRMEHDVDGAMREIRKGAEKAEEAIEEVGDAAKEAGEGGAKGGGKLLDMFKKITPSAKGAGAASALFSNPWTAAIAGVVLAIGGVALGIAKLVNDADKEFDRMQTKIGASKEEMEGLKDAAMGVYAQGFGDDLGSVAMDVATVKQAFKNLDDGAIEKLTSGAYMLKDVFGPEVKETTKAIKTMTANFKGLSEQEALDLITLGFQKGGDYADDFLDTVNEYSSYFEKLGVSADKFVGTLIRGGEAGAFNLDKVGDSFKELGIRAIDGSDATKDAFSKLGFDANKMGQDFAAGGDKAHQALMATVAALSFVDDAQEQNAIGVQLFGTQWEDMRKEVIFAMDGAEEAVEGFQGATDRATETLQDNFGTKWTQITRGFKTSIIEAFDGGGEAMSGMLDKVLDFMPMITDGIKTAVDWIKGVFSDNESSISAFTDGVISAFSGLWTFIEGLWNILGPFLTEVFSGALGVVLSVAGSVLGAIGDIFGIFGDLLQGNWGDAWEGVKNLFSGILWGLLDLGKNLLDLLIGIFDSTIGRIINLFTDFDLRETGTNIIMGLVDGVKSAASFAVDAITNVASSMWNGIKNFFGIASPSKLMMQAGEWVIEGLKNGITNMGSAAVDSVKNVASNIWGGVKDFFGINSPSKLMTEAGGFIAEGLEVGIDKHAAAAIDAASQLSTGVGGAITDSPEVAGLIAESDNKGPEDAKPKPPPPPPPEGVQPTPAPININMPINITMPEGTSKEEAAEFGGEIGRRVREELAVIFTQLGIAIT